MTTPSRLDDPARLAALHAAGPFDRDAAAAFGPIARLARQVLDGSVATVSVIDDRLQRVLGQSGLDGPADDLRDIPIEDSVCARVILGGDAVVIDDVREHPLLRGIPGITRFGAVAYAGVPIATADGHLPGVLSVLDERPRSWSDRDLELLRGLASLAAAEFDRRVGRGSRRDVTEAARSAAMLERYRLLSREGRDIILFMRPGGGQLVEANEAAVSAYGYSREALLRLRAVDLRAAAAPPIAADSLARAAASDALLESVHRRQDGTTFPIEASVRVFEVGGERLVLAIIRDVTDRKAAEHERAQLLVRAEVARAEAERANQLKDEFLATLSHELRTPLNAILGWTRMLQTGQVTEARRPHALATIERNAHLQARLVDDILDVSRIVSGKLPLSITALDPLAVVADAVDSIRLAAEARSLHLEVSCERDVGSVYADASRMQQVIWNLLSNAVKFTPRGGRVTVRARRVDEHLEIEVSDTGQGIAPEFLPHVFERFRQADAGSARQHGGLGLGLAIVRHVVELHGGSVAAHSEGSGLGSTFIARFPLIAHEAERSARSPDPAALAAPSEFEASSDREPSLEGIRALVVDDDVDARELLRSLLQSCGATVTAAADAAEASVALRALRPDVMVSDIGMPGEDGFALIARVRRWTPSEGGAVPAIALTAFARPEDRARALSAGFSAYLTKPVDLSQLLKTVARLLGRPPGP